MSVVRLRLDGAYNTRDLGGYENIDGQITRWKRILRSDSLGNLSEADITRLKTEYKLKLVIDLRSHHENILVPSKLAYQPDVEYINISLMEEVAPSSTVGLDQISETFLRDGYIEMIDNRQTEISRVLKLIFTADKDSSVMFNCTAGQDRTGVIAMLILGLCGVTKQDIASNYMQSSNNLKYNLKMQEQLQAMFGEILANTTDKILKETKSVPENIEYVVDYINEKYNGFIEYYLRIGGSKQELEQFKLSFLN